MKRTFTNRGSSGVAFTVWFTGLSGSGKSTLANKLASYLTQQSLRCEVLDGDELRRSLCADLGFSEEDRNENVRRISHVARLLNGNNIICAVAAISPYSAAREEARETCRRFVEVHVDCALEILIRRDTKGLYRRALSGDLDHFSGVSDPYEAPESPDVYLNSGSQTEEESFELLLVGLRRLRLLPDVAAGL